MVKKTESRSQGMNNGSEDIAQGSAENSHNEEYNRIMKLAGNEDLKQAVSRWERFYCSMRRIGSADVNTYIPNMLWASHSGVGQTTMLGLISKYLRSRRLLEFRGNTDFIEFVFRRNKGEPDHSFIELQRLDDTLRSVSGLHNMFQGVVCIDITEWTEHINESRFSSFLEYLKDHDELWMIILTVDTRGDDGTSNEEILKRVYTYIHSIVRVDLVRTSFPEKQEMTAYLGRKLAEMGFGLSDDAETLLSRSMEEMSKSEIYDGYNTIRVFAKDIIYHLLTLNEASSKTISAEDVKEFSVDSEYMELFKKSAEEHKRIGFI